MRSQSFQELEKCLSSWGTEPFCVDGTHHEPFTTSTCDSKKVGMDFNNSLSMQFNPTHI